MLYQEYIQSIIDDRGQWSPIFREQKICCERHHIIPKCLGGEPNKLSWKHHDNVIWLHPREHFIAHKLLMQENPNNYKLLNAYMMMAYPKGKTKRDYEITEEEYQELRTQWSNYCRKHNFGKGPDGHPWNYGKPMSDEQKKKLSETKIGKPIKKRNEEQKQHYKEAIRNRVLNNPESFKGRERGKKCITNGVINKYIYPDETLPNGFIYGMTTKKVHDMTKYYQNEEMRKNKSLKASGKNNGMFGKGYKLSGGNNGKATKRYFFADMIFECRKELVEYLKDNFDDTISVSTVRKFEEGSVRVVKKYPLVFNNLRWEYK